MGSPKIRVPGNTYRAQHSRLNSVPSDVSSPRKKSLYLAVNLDLSNPSTAIKMGTPQNLLTEPSRAQFRQSDLNDVEHSRRHTRTPRSGKSRNSRASESDLVLQTTRDEQRRSSRSRDRDEKDEKSAATRARHISLQSRVDSIANESLYLRASMPDIPAVFGGNLPPGRPPVYPSLAPSASCILDPIYSQEYQQVPLDDRYLEKPLPETTPELVRMSPFRESLFVGTVAVSHLMTQAALGQALAPIDIIAADFGTVSQGQMSWFIAAYSLTVGTFILISGRLGDILGNGRIFAFGYAWLGVWSCFAGFSVYPKKQVFFDVCRAMQGIGPALLLPNALALLSHAYPPGIRKNIMFSIFGAMAPAGFVVGATFGSFFSELVWWPWAFWSFGLACFGLAALAMLVIPRPLKLRPNDPPGFDFTGSLVGVAGLVLVNVAWNNGPLYGWGAPHVYFVLIIGLLCLVAFVWVERRALHPILPIHAMNGTIAFVLALVGVGWGSFGVWVFYVWRFLEKARLLAPLDASSQFAPAVVCGLLAAGLTGFLLTHTPVSFVMMMSMMAFLTGLIIAATMPVQQHYWSQLFISIVIMPFGMDMSFPAATVILSNHMPREHQGLAGSLVNTVVNYSISIALGIAGTVEVATTHKSTSPEDFIWGLRCALYTGVGLAGMGVILGVLFFSYSMMREGWRIMEH
jgi:MFS family permease